MLGMVVLSLTLALVSGVRSQTHINREFSNLGSQNALLGAQIIEYVVEKAVDNGVFDLNAVFKGTYQPISKASPRRYHTDYDYYFDRNVKTILNAFLAANDIYYAHVVNNDGYIPAHPDPRLSKTRIDPLPPCAAGGGDPDRPHASIVKDRDGHTYNEYHAPIMVCGQRWGEFRVGIPAALINNNVCDDIVDTLLMTVLFSLPIVGLMFYLVNRSLRPLRELTRATRRMAEGDLAVRCEYQSRDELGGLAPSLNALAKRTARAHENLEQQVRQRTTELERTNQNLQTEIAERKRAVESLRESETRLKVILDAIHAGVLLIDVETHIIVDANPSSLNMIGGTRAQLVGHVCHKCVCPAEAGRCPITDLGASMDNSERVLLKADGQRIPILKTVTPITLGGRRYLLKSFVDITERKRTEVELARARDAAEAATNAKSEFLANMSHEIRTPITAILGFADVLLEQGSIEEAPPEPIEAAKTIESNGEYLLSILNDILDLSKIEAGRMTVERIPCSPCRIIAEVASLMRVRANAKGLPLKLEYVGAVPETIRTDPTRLRQILVNVIGNAIKFTEVGHIRLVTQFVEDPEALAPDRATARGSATPPPSASQPPEPSLQFDVIDTGIGITGEQVARLFQPFVQGDTSTVRKFGGTGLGLTISSRLAQMLGGEIRGVESRLGAGTHLRVTVATGGLDGVRMINDPVSATAVRNDAQEKTARTRIPLLNGCRILLAEDGPDNQRLIAHVLRKANADITVVENGETALRDEGLFDAIFMNMQTPVMDGYAATVLLRQKGYTGPIVALTAHAMASDREKCIAAGCDDYATKPIDRKGLIAVIARYWQRNEQASPVAIL
jgi:PAS domain S-box-containing protein